LRVFGAYLRRLPDAFREFHTRIHGFLLRGEAITPRGVASVLAAIPETAQGVLEQPVLALSSPVAFRVAQHQLAGVVLEASEKLGAWIDDDQRVGRLSGEGADYLRRRVGEIEAAAEALLCVTWDDYLGVVIEQSRVYVQAMGALLASGRSTVSPREQLEAHVEEHRQRMQAAEALRGSAAVQSLVAWAEELEAAQIE
jgi:hypothetical protein